MRTWHGRLSLWTIKKCSYYYPVSAHRLMDRTWQILISLQIEKEKHETRKHPQTIAIMVKWGSLGMLDGRSRTEQSRMQFSRRDSIHVVTMKCDDHQWPSSLHNPGLSLETIYRWPGENNIERVTMCLCKLHATHNKSHANITDYKTEYLLHNRMHLLFIMLFSVYLFIESSTSRRCPSILFFSCCLASSTRDQQIAIWYLLI